MNENSRMVDILIEDYKYTDPRTGVEIISDWYFIVWADEDMKSVIEAVEGIDKACNTTFKTRFEVCYDKRYDREALKAEITAAIKNAKGLQ